MREGDRGGETEGGGTGGMKSVVESMREKWSRERRDVKKER